MNLNEDLMFITEDQVEEIFGTQVEDIVDTQKYLIFNTDNLKFGIDANSVVEIITNYSITFLPMLPDFVRGIFNLRGDMIPILDIRLRLGKESKEDCLVIVLNVDGTQLGLLVDSVDQMLDIPKDDILPTPVNHTQKLVGGMEKSAGETRFGSSILSESLFLQLMVELNRCVLEASPSQPRDIDPKIDEALRYINNNLSGELSVDSLAGMCYLSRYYFMRRSILRRAETQTVGLTASL